MTREEARKIIRKMLAVTDLSVRGNLKEDMVKACNMAIEALKQEPKTDTWSIKDVADTLTEHGLMTEQESCKDCIERNNAFFKKWINHKMLDEIKAEIDREYKWLMNTRYTIHDVNIAFGYILGIIERYMGKQDE